jgi:glutamyl-tRNA synthetase
MSINTDKKIRVRFAPSPTGFMHIGNARTALFNWLFARHNNGTFILRIEDTDLERSTEESITKITDALKWLSLDWDEGYEKNGEFGPYRQIERLEIYKKHTDKLLAENKAYRCFCTEEELEAKRQDALKKGFTPKYDGKCRNLTKEEIENNEKQGIKYSIRFKVPYGTVTVNDIIRGKVEFLSQTIGDFIIVRQNGIPAYNFAVVVDDALMQITHVIRGEDHLSNTPRQILLYQAFNFFIPQFAHLPMILGMDKTRLSKRHGATSVEEYRDKGFLSQALINYLSLLGWYPEDGKEIMPIEGIIKNFSLERVGKSASVFDDVKLKWMNSIYIREMDINKITEIALPLLKQKGLVKDELNKEYLKEVINLVRGYSDTINDIPLHAELVLSDLVTDFEEEAINLLKTDDAKTIVSTFKTEIEKLQDLTEANFKQAVSNTQKATGKKGKDLFMPIRIALTGKIHGPELNRLVPLLGKEKILKRLLKVVY